ncbi:MAG: hypothetical protein MUO89_08375 [Dehalococcoidia bacterium]|nr:hypothetical protein [Dehalococcoidia bacterium]
MPKYFPIKRVAAMIIIAAVQATQWGFNFQQIFGLNIKWLPAVSLPIFLGIVIWTIWDLCKKVERLEDVKPSIDVQQIKEGDTLYLKVHNNGAEATFKAQIQLSSDDPAVQCLPHYSGYWKYGNKDETKILKGQHDLLKIAEVISSPPDYDSIRLHIFFYDTFSGHARAVSTSSYWIGATLTSKDGSTKPMAKHDYKLCVTISSSPELKEGIFSREYVLNVDDLREASPRLNSH